MAESRAVGQDRAYPARWEADTVLPDGGTARIRPVTPADDHEIAALHERLSPETIYLRFLSELPRLSAALLARFTNVDYVDRLALVAEVGTDVVALARYDRIRSSAQAEVAIVVEDAHQGRGIGTALLERLAEAARETGMTGLVAETLPSNSRVLSVLLNAGFESHRGLDDGMVRLTLDLTR